MGFLLQYIPFLFVLSVYLFLFSCGAFSLINLVEPWITARVLAESVGMGVWEMADCPLSDVSLPVCQLLSMLVYPWSQLLLLLLLLLFHLILYTSLLPWCIMIVPI